MKLLKLLTLILLFSGTQVMAQSSSMYAVDPYTDTLYVMDSTTLSIVSSVPLTSSLGVVTGSNGLAVRPCYGDVYVVIKVTGVTGRVLGIVDPSTGVVTTVGNMGDNVAGICFGDIDHLYAVTGDGAAVAESLFKVNIATGAMTLFTSYGAGSDGENIGFCPDNGKIYHWSGRNTNPAMESTDTLTGTVTTITRTGYNYDEVFGSVYVGNGNFLLANLMQEFILVDTSGFATLTPFSTSPNYWKGMVFPLPTNPPFISTVDSTKFCPGDSSLFDVTAGLSYQWYLDGVAIPGATAQTYYASTPGVLYATVDNGECALPSNQETLSYFNVPLVTIVPGDTAICAGDSLLLTGSNGGTSQWFMDGMMIPGATTTTYYVSQEGMYNMTKTNQNGCTDSSAVGTYITVNNLPLVTITPANDTSYCIGDSILLTGTSGGSAQWYMNGTMIAGATSNMLYVSAPGVYNMVKTNTNGCADSSAVGVMVLADTCDASILELIQQESLKVYPSPVEDQLHVAFTAFEGAELALEIYGVNGELIAQLNRSAVPGKNEFTIATSDFTSGVYVLRLVHGKGVITSRFVK